MSHTVYIAIGSNLEPRLGHLHDAVRALGVVVTLEAVSAIYETAPVGYTEQPSFLNAAVKVTTDLEPVALLHELRTLEEKLGRRVRPRWHEREIDFDILFYDSLVLSSSELTIPHPELARRAFVLEPLADIASKFAHPVLDKSVTELLESPALDRSGIRKTEWSLV